jgi:putative transcriptional regulator
MAQEAGTDEEASVLRSKRNATRYQILVEIAERQPAVSQQEIATAIDVTPQAISDYLKGLIEDGYVEKHGRGRYEVTKNGVDWLISQTDRLAELVAHVSEDVIGQVDIETAIAATGVSEGEAVSLVMREGVLHAVAGRTGNATAVAVTSAEAGGDVGVTDFEGVVDYELGIVTVVSVPPVQEGGSEAVRSVGVGELAADHEVIATAGTEALVAARALDIEPDIRFGSQHAVQEAATRGLDVLLLAVADELSAHTNRLREGSVSYEVIDPPAE